MFSFLTLGADGRSRLAPEVIQASAAASSTAVLRCALLGLGAPVDEARLREATQPVAGGTPMERLERAARHVGLEAEQGWAALEHLGAATSGRLPVLLELRDEGRRGRTAILWRHARGRFQLMDPLRGRRFLQEEELAREVVTGTRLMDAADWRAWAGTEAFTGPLRAHLRRLGVKDERGQELLSSALAAPGWRPLAELEAAVRLVGTLVRRGAVRAGSESARMVLSLVGQPIPDAFWSVRPDPSGDEGPERLQVHGVPFVQLRAPPTVTARESAPSTAKPSTAKPSSQASEPRRRFLQRVREAGPWPIALVIGSVLLGAGAVVLEALIFRGLIDLGHLLGLPLERMGMLLAVFVFLSAMLLLEVPLAAVIKRLGRRLDLGLRSSFLEKLARLEDRFFRSRSTADLAHRAHDMHRLRGVYELWARLLRAWAEIAATAAGLIWLSPSSAPLALLAAASSILIPLGMQPALMRTDLRTRTHQGALGRFILDALTGLMAARAHGAERALRREHEHLVTEWVRAARATHRAYAVAEGIQLLAGFGLAGWLVTSHLAANGSGGVVLLLIYWALSLPTLGQECVSLARLAPPQQNAALRLLEPLNVPDERDPAAGLDEGTPPGGPVGISMRGVSVRAGGQLLLRELELSVAPGEHVALVGASGAGKSTLVGLLLGWYRAAEGRVEVDGVPLEGAALERLRRCTAWVEPEVRLWNRSLLDNLRYGSDGSRRDPLATVLRQADLLRLVESLPEGLQTQLGEGGGLVSGGEGQRVRLGRSLLRPGARLVILDEPFRGLDRAQRHTLLARAREHWKDATLLCVTHDVADTSGFSRVLLVEGGRVVEDGPPAELAAREGSRYRAMLEADEAVRAALWDAAGWRWLRLVKGRLEERARRAG
jgi:ATP-binding cassette subfamily B protein